MPQKLDDLQAEEERLVDLQDETRGSAVERQQASLLGYGTGDEGDEDVDQDSDNTGAQPKTPTQLRGGLVRCFLPNEQRTTLRTKVRHSLSLSDCI